jgi:signal transduction histidine kinase
MFSSLTSKFMLGITVIVGSVLAVTLLWDFRYYERRADDELLLKADLVATQIKATRSFFARSHDKVHGDDPVPQPSPMGKEVNDLFADMANSQVKQTRLVVRDGENQPDEFERAALIAFSEDGERTNVTGRGLAPDGTPVFRYVTALRAEENCLSCHGEPRGELDKTGHAKEGYKLGDLAGAISVSVPMADVLRSARQETYRMAGAIVLVAALSLALIWFIVNRQVKQPLRQLASVAESVDRGHIAIPARDLEPLYASRETAVVADAFKAMANRLEDLYAGLEQKVNERTSQLQAANSELERASRHQSEFLTMVSHEFRTPLTSIITFTELLLDSAAGQVNQEQHEYLTDVFESSQRLLHMINDLLDLSRLEAGKVKLFREALDLKDLARDAERTVRPLAERKELTLRLDLPSGLPLVEADGLRVTQVLLNLFSNAIKFTPSGGTITVSARVREPWLEVAVSDTGIGIARNDLKRIFEKFSQSGRERPEGTGLGLPLARSLVELHGGQMWVESEIGQGSTFRFTLPLFAEEGRFTHDDRSEEDPGGR